MWTVYTILGIVLISLVVISMTAAWEKRQIWPYVPINEMPANQVPDPSEYARIAVTSAMSAGFTYLGAFGDGKGKLYRIRYEMFRSPAGEALAIVSSGSVASIPVGGTWLHTLLADGRCLTTIDHQSQGEIDLGGLIDEALVPNVAFDTLVDLHRARVASSGMAAVPFKEHSPLGDFRDFRQRRVDQLARLGYATFLDTSHAVWRYSVKGAIALACRNYFNGLRRTVISDRRALPRPYRKSR